MKTPATPLIVDSSEYKDGRVQVRFDKIESPRYQYTQEDLLSSQAVTQLVFDKSLLVIAQAYLKSRPVMDMVTMWWSFPFHGKGQSGAAQQYHFDMDRIKFLKFFFYLTDVHSDNGPHCYVAGSHKDKPKAVFRDGRISDAEIKKHYSDNRFLEFNGPAGTILAVDTSGFHKGKVLTEGRRLLLQIEFANSLFGQNYKKITLPNPKVKLKVDSFNRIYDRIFK
jgi:ectoine hydroxylase-related dioxygenase (phytanoyl-CoA dioxygenase family)